MRTSSRFFCIAFAQAAITGCAPSGTPRNPNAPPRAAPLGSEPTRSPPPAGSAAPRASGAPAIAESGLAPPEKHPEHRRTPPEVASELEQWDKEYERLPRLRVLPDFLSVDAVIALMPEESERQYLREEIHTELEGGENGPLFGTYLGDENERLFVLWLHGNLTQVLAVYDGKRLASKRVVSRGEPFLGDILSEKDGSRPEILIERITTMSACCYPMSLEVLRVGKRGELREVLNFPRGHSDVGENVTWSFLNHFEFGDGRVVVNDVLSPNGPRYELVYDARSGRFQPTPATAKLLGEEKRARSKAKAEGNDDRHGSPGGELGY